MFTSLCQAICLMFTSLSADHVFKALQKAQQTNLKLEPRAHRTLKLRFILPMDKYLNIFLFSKY